MQRTLIKVQPKLTENGLSVYSGELTLQTVIEQNMQIKRAFPNLPNDWYDVFQSRITENGFTDERLIDAVNYVIDNCPYPTPTIAQFIQFDKKIPVKTHKQLLEMLNEDRNIFNRYQAIKIEGIDLPVYALNEDVQKYKLKLFTKEDKMSLQEKLENQRQIRRIQNEIERLENTRNNINRKDISKRTYDETKFIEGVDTIEKLIRELQNYNQ